MLVKSNDDNEGHVEDAVYCDYPADELLRRLKIEVQG